MGFWTRAAPTYEPVQKGYAGATAKLTDSAASDGEEIPPR
jgi:hypothetical protein